jgi:hypothetical protein
MSDTPRTDAEALKSRPPFALVTRKYAEQLERELNAANAELERERMRLAACGVVADANTPESAKKWRNMRDEYRSASCDGVARAVDREMRLRRALQKIGNDWCVPPMIADEALTAIEDVRKVERKLNEVLKENVRLRPALMGFSQAEELMELREDLQQLTNHKLVED